MSPKYEPSSEPLHISAMETELDSSTVFFSASSSLASLEWRDTKVYEPDTRARLGTTAHFCKAIVLKLGISKPGTWNSQTVEF